MDCAQNSDETGSGEGDNSNGGCSIIGGGIAGATGTESDDQARLRLKRKLQRNRTSFTNDQIDSLEKGSFKLPYLLARWIFRWNDDI